MYTNMRIMKIKLVPGASVGLHKHETSSEIVFVLEGTGTAIYDGQKGETSGRHLPLLPQRT